MLKENELLRPEEPTALEQKREFLKLPLAERRRILLTQAKGAECLYASEENREREPWQGGDIVNY
jgi:hypothetical protein